MLKLNLEKEKCLLLQSHKGKSNIYRKSHIKYRVKYGLKGINRRNLTLSTCQLPSLTPPLIHSCFVSTYEQKTWNR